jgi:arylsulfatase A
VIKGPRIWGGTQSDVPVIAYDFFPSIRSMLNIKAPLPDGIEGGDLMPLLVGSDGGEVERSRKEFVWHFPHYEDDKGAIPQSAIRLGDYKLIHLYGPDKDFLYNLKDDIEESKDLVKSHPAQAKALKEKLLQYFEDIDAGMPTVSDNKNKRRSGKAR